MGRAATLLMLLGIVSAPVASISELFSRFLFTVLLVYIFIGISGFVGSILLIITMNRFANLYNEPGIFRNTLYGFLTGILGGIAFLLLIFWLIFSTILHIGTSVSTSTAVTPAFSYVLGLVIIVWIGAFAITLAQSLFYRAAFNALAEKSGEGYFKTASLLMLIGGVLTIIFVGLFVLFVAWILVCAGFFSMKPPPNPQTFTSFQQPSATAWAQKVCPNCGAINYETAAYCTRCGTKL